MSENPIMGTICLFPYDFELRGWNYCDGRLLSVSQNPGLANY